MSRADAIAELIAKVEAGEPIDDTRPIGDIDVYAQVHFHNAYQGDLNAALALHQAVLPGWEYGYDGSIAWVKQNGLRPSYRHDAGNGYTARAWLLAILKAMQSMEADRIHNAAVSLLRQTDPMKQETDK